MSTNLKLLNIVNKLSSFFKDKQRSFVISKKDISFRVVAYDPFLVFNLPTLAKPVVRYLLSIIFGKIDGKVIFDKKIYKKTILQLVRYVHFQLPIVFQVVFGVLLYRLRKLLGLEIVFKLGNRFVNKDVKIVRYFVFSGVVNCLVYANHVPLSFMAFQTDGKTLATSFRDINYAKKVFNKFKFSGYAVLAWTSNYFLGYPTRITLDTSTSKPDLKSLLITTTASIPGYNPGLASKEFFKKALQKEYSEESFPRNPDAINFSPISDSMITKPIVIRRNKEQYTFSFVSNSESLKYVGKSETVNIIYPIAVLTKENSKSPEWIGTPQKNISGFLLGFKDGQPVSVSVSSTSLVRMQVNELLPFLERLCDDEHIEFFAYIHTDDGGSVGDFYLNGKKVQKYSPIWGHCFSSMVGFVSLDRVKETLSQLKNYKS